jgi:hypothetical protein
MPTLESQAIQKSLAASLLKTFTKSILISGLIGRMIIGNYHALRIVTPHLRFQGVRTDSMLDAKLLLRGRIYR